MTKIQNKLICFSIVITAIFIASNVNAAIKSENYIIYDSVMHTFDGPAISNVSYSVSGNTTTVTWDTNVVADSYVVYDTDNSFATAKEQGMSAKTSTSHSVDVTGLEYSSTYYFRVKSTRINGGITTDTTTYSFSTGAAPTTPGEGEETPSSGGGGIIIIDKTDKGPPLITNVQISDITSDSATISWETDEDATSFVEYGETTSYGSTYGRWGTSTSHIVTLEGLSGSTLYHFRTLSSDSWGNVGYSDDFQFTTELGEGEEEEEEEVEEEPAETPTPEEIDETILAEATRRAIEFIRRLFPQVALNEITDPLEDITSLEDIVDFIPAPILLGEPRIDIGATEATIYWTTDIESDSQVAMAPDSGYNAEADEPYLQIIGNTDEYSTDHEVTIYGLEPDTLYHYQIRSKGRLGPAANSRDFTFRTNSEELTITSFFTQVIDDQTVVFKWVTNKEADSAVEFAPYLGNVLALDQSKTVRDTAISVIHEITISDFVGGTYYDVKLISIDNAGNVAQEVLSRFSTSEDDLPPEISHVKADSTVFLDRSDKIQTIISWTTNEPATSMVHYQEGVQASDAELAEKTTLNTNYTKEHVMVISKFKPGVVYSFRVESVDSGGNISISKLHTFMTAKKRESIIQIIMNILENTFGWVKNIF
jgi:hypothetical protein